MCFVVLTKRGGPFITMNGGRHGIFYCIVLEHIQKQSVLPDPWLDNGGNLWFMIYDSLAYIHCMCKYFILKKLVLCIHQVKFNRSRAPPQVEVARRITPGIIP